MYVCKYVCMYVCIQIDEDWFGLLPVIDMANHALEPNADLTYLFSSSAEQSQVCMYVCIQYVKISRLSQKSFMYVCMYVC